MRINTPPHTSLNPRDSVDKKKAGRAPWKPITQNKVPQNSLIGKGSSLPITRDELSALAEDFKNGTIGREEAHNRFLMTVINNSIRNKLGEKDREQLIHDIKEFFANDPILCKSSLRT